MDPIAVNFYVRSANFQNYVFLFANCSPTMGSQQKNIHILFLLPSIFESKNSTGSKQKFIRNIIQIQTFLSNVFLLF